MYSLLDYGQSHFLLTSACLPQQLCTGRIARCSSSKGTNPLCFHIDPPTIRYRPFSVLAHHPPLSPTARFPPALRTSPAPAPRVVRPHPYPQLRFHLRAPHIHPRPSSLCHCDSLPMLRDPVGTDTLRCRYPDQSREHRHQMIASG